MMQPVTAAIQKLMERDLQKLAAEINLYTDESRLWQVSGDIKNPAGNLCLHICGNLQYFIGAVLGKNGYIRNRDFEFSARGISREKLIEEITNTQKAISQTLPALTLADLEKEYPQQVLGYPMSTQYFLIHLTAHLEYHLGQINYHRRLV